MTDFLTEDDARDLVKEYMEIERAHPSRSTQEILDRASQIINLFI